MAVWENGSKSYNQTIRNNAPANRMCTSDATHWRPLPGVRWMSFRPFSMLMANSEPARDRTSILSNFGSSYTYNSHAVLGSIFFSLTKMHRICELDSSQMSISSGSRAHRSLSCFFRSQYFISEFSLRPYFTGTEPSSMVTRKGRSRKRYKGIIIKFNKLGKKGDYLGHAK